MSPRKLTYTALFLSLTIVFPIVFHQFGLMGRIFLPMHVPVMICGFLLGPTPAVIVGLLGPFISHLISGMPPTYAVPLMTMELAIYGFITGISYRYLKLNIYLALLVSMVFGRLAFALGLGVMGLFVALPYGPAEFFAGGIIIAGWPGILLQFIAVPPIVVSLKRYAKVS